MRIRKTSSAATGEGSTRWKLGYWVPKTTIARHHRSLGNKLVLRWNVSSLNRLFYYRAREPKTSRNEKGSEKKVMRRKGIKGESVLLFESEQLRENRTAFERRVEKIVG